jgi:hypothetical protein
MITVQEARDAFLARRGFTTESYDAPIVPIPIGPLTIPLPSSEGRRALVRWHDLHHVLTGYDTDFVGEGEIGVWELRAGCTNLAGYVYNGMAVAMVAGSSTPTLARIAMAAPCADGMPNMRRRCGRASPVTGPASAWRSSPARVAPI